MNYIERKESLTEYIKNYKKTDQFLRLYGKWMDPELPAEIGDLKELLTLDFYNTNINFIPDSIGNLLNLEELGFSSTDIKSLPKTVSRLKKLKSLHINIPLDNYDFLEGLENLDTLVLTGCGLSAFPEAIRKMKNLQILNLSENSIQNYPEWMTELTCLRRLMLSKNPLKNISFGPNNSSLEKIDLEYCELGELPDSIGFLTNLNTLNLYKNNITELPATVNKLENLESLNIDKNPLKSFPQDFSGLQTLKYLQFDHKWMSDFPAALLQLGSLIKLPKSKNVPERAQMIPSLARECQKKGYGSEYALFLLDLLAERKAAVKKHPKYRTLLCEAMNCAVPAIHSTVIELLNETELKNPEKGSSVFIAGNTGFNLNELKERLKSLELVYSTKLNDNVSLIVLGKSPKKLAAEIAGQKGLLISEQGLLELLNQAEKPYLIDASATEEGTQNLSALLLSGQPENISIAVEMMSKGGVPNELLTDLLIIYFGEEDKKIKAKVRKLLEQYGPAALLPSYSLVNSPVRNIFNLKDVSKFQKNFEPISEEFGFDKLKILKNLQSLGYHEYVAGTVNSFLLKYLPENEALDFFISMVSNGSLNLSYHPIQLIPEKLLENSKLKEAVKDLKMDNCSIKKIPEAVFGFKKLEKLSVYSNSISVLPADFKELTALKYFSANYNNFKEFPAVLTEMKNLEILILGFNKIKTLPDSMLKMEALSELQMCNCMFEKIPQVLFGMKRLKSLDIRKTFNTMLYSGEEKKALMEALPESKVSV